MFGLVLHVKSKHRTGACLSYLYNIDIFQYTNTKIYPLFTKQYIYKIKYSLLYHSQIYAIVYIGIVSTYMYKGHLNNTALNKVLVAMSVEHRTSDLRSVGSNPTVGKKCFNCLFWRARGRSRTNEIKHDLHARYIWTQMEDHLNKKWRRY